MQQVRRTVPGYLLRFTIREEHQRAVYVCLRHRWLPSDRLVQIDEREGMLTERGMGRTAVVVGRGRRREFD